MKTHTQICPLTKVEKVFDVIADGFCVNSFKNGRGQTSVTLFRIILPNGVDKVSTFVAEREGNDLVAIKEELKFNSVNEDISSELNAYLVSKL